MLQSMKLGMLVLMASLLAACSSLPESQSVRVEGMPMVYNKQGQGSPTIVLEAGLGDDMTSWREVIQPLSSVSTVFAYNRAGYAPSGSRDRSREPAQVVEDLHKLLGNAGLKPPYILVGHSLGGVYMLDFAQRYPEEVAGLVLIDTRHPLFSQTCESRGVSSCYLSEPLRLLLPSHVRREYDDAQSGRPPASLGSMPLVVVSRTPMQGSGSKQWHRLWQEMQRDLAELSVNSRLIVAKDSGHYVHKQEPARLLEAIEWVMSSPKSKRVGLTEWVPGGFRPKAQGY